MSAIIALVLSQNFWTAITAVVAGASAIANLTPTDHDNKVISNIGKIINLFALNFRK